MRTIAAAAVAAIVLILPAGTAGGATGFTPKAIKGVYKGTWKNTTFNVEGTFSVTFAAKNKNKVLKISAAVGGTGFGCQTVPSFPAVSLTKGSGKNHWDSTGFRIKKSGDFGSIDVKYFGGKLTGTGKAPPACAPNVTYKIDGGIRAGSVYGTATINLGSRTAKTTFDAVRQ